MILRQCRKFCRVPVPLRAAVFLLLFALFLPAATLAKSLAEYEKNVESAQKSIVELLYPNDEDLADKNYAAFERKTVAKIRAEIPSTEKIEWQGAETETSNLWLSDKLDEYEREAKNPARREAVLSEIAERLAAIEKKIKELENPAASERTKDEDKRKLADILRREEYQKPSEKEESLFQKIYRLVIEWLAKMFPRPSMPESAPGGFESISFVLQLVLYALVLGAVGFLIYRFAPPLFERFQNREKKEKRERVILGERLAAEETAQSLFDEAERLAREGNLRGAIRKGYIALLCELADRRIIRLSRHKTNRDYLRDVRGKSALYESMNGITTNFERHWYGFETVDETDWKEFKDGCEKTLNR